MNLDGSNIRQSMDLQKNKEKDDKDKLNAENFNLNLHPGGHSPKKSKMPTLSLDLQV